MEGSGYSEYKGYEDEVQALERISRDLKEVKETMNQRDGGRLN